LYEFNLLSAFSLTANHPSTRLVICYKALMFRFLLEKIHNRIKYSNNNKKNKCTAASFCVLEDEVYLVVVPEEISHEHTKRFCVYFS
jgi:hypothetical protein